MPASGDRTQPAKRKFRGLVVFFGGVRQASSPELPPRLAGREEAENLKLIGGVASGVVAIVAEPSNGEDQFRGNLKQTAAASGFSIPREVSVSDAFKLRRKGSTRF